MNQSRIWLVVKPTIGLPLFLGTVLVISLLIHYSVLTHTDWFGAFWEGGAKAAQVTAPAPAPVAEPAAAPVAEAAAAEAAPVGRVFFDVNKSDQWLEGDDAIAAVSSYLQSHATAKASISGYHDPSGDQASNQKLAKERALLVRDALVGKGVAADRLQLQKPVETTGSGDPRDARRVEITIQP